MKMSAKARVRAALALLALCGVSTFGVSVGYAATAVSGVGTTSTFNQKKASAAGTNATAVGDSATAKGNYW